MSQEHFSFYLSICWKIHKILGCLEDTDANMEINSDKSSCRGSSTQSRDHCKSRSWHFCVYCLISNPSLYSFCEWFCFSQVWVGWGKLRYTIAACGFSPTSPPLKLPLPLLASDSGGSIPLSRPAKRPSSGAAAEGKLEDTKGRRGFYIKPILWKYINARGCFEVPTQSWGAGQEGNIWEASKPPLAVGLTQAQEGLLDIFWIF